MKVVLADPPAPAWNSFMRQFPNLGLLYLAAYLRRAIPDVEICYIDSIHSIREHLDRVVEQQPLIYGFSFSSPLLPVAMEVLRKVREVTPQTLIVCGGPHPTADPDDVLRRTPADICCIGEGEETFVELINEYRRGGSLAGVAGIAYRNDIGDVVRTPRRPFITDLDCIPMPAWDLVDLHRFQGVRQAKSGPSTAITANRGCPFNCTFCSSPIWKSATPWVRRRSPQRVAEEVELLYGRGIREIYILSDLMNDKVEWAIGVFDALHNLKHPDLYFQCHLHLSHITSNLALAMKRAGCWMCRVGIESGSQRVLDGIKKKTRLSESNTHLQILKDQGIKVYAFMMLYQLWEADGALKVETTREVFHSLRLVLSLRWKALIDQISWAFATPYPGSDLYRVCKKYGLLRHDFDRSLISSDRMAICIPGLSPLEILAARVSGLLVQGMLNLSHRERYEPHVLVPNLKHMMMKLRHALMDICTLVWQGACAAFVFRFKGSRPQRGMVVESDLARNEAVSCHNVGMPVEPRSPGGT